MTDLPPKVRDRAAQAAEASMGEWGEHYDDVDRRMTLEVVDAVAEVLAAEAYWRQGYDAVRRGNVELRARVAELTAALTRLVECIAPGDVPNDALRNARAALAAAVERSSDV